MQSNPIWSIGAVIAPDSAVKAPHNITRQMTQHKPSGIESELKYRSKAWTRDFVATNHHLCAVLPNPEVDGIEICPLWKAWGYNVRCGPMKRGVKPTTIPKEFFTSHGIKGFDYEALSRPYSNRLLNEDAELDGETDSDDDIEVEELAGKSGEIASSGNQSIMAQSASQVDVDMDIVSPVEVPAQVPAQAPEQVTEKVPDDVKEEATEEVKEKIAEEVTGKVLDDVKEEVTEEVTGKVSDDVKEKATEEATEEATEGVAKEVTEEITKEVENEALEETTKDLKIAPSEHEEPKIAEGLTS